MYVCSGHSVCVRLLSSHIFSLLTRSPNISYRLVIIAFCFFFFSLSLSSLSNNNFFGGCLNSDVARSTAQHFWHILGVIVGDTRRRFVGMDEVMVCELLLEKALVAKFQNK